jgi:hypothetical protein
MGTRARILYPLLFAGSTLLANAAPALNAAEGQITMDDTVVKVTYAYGWQVPDAFDHGKQLTHVIFSDMPLDTHKLDRYQEVHFIVGNSARKKGAKFLEVELEPDGNVHMVFPSAAVQGVIAERFADLKVAAPKITKGNDGQMTIELRSSQPIPYNRGKDKGEGKLTFALVGTYRFSDRTPKGKPLPDDGGDPGKAYQAFHTARLKSDFAGMSKLMDDFNAATLKEDLTDPDFREYWAVMVKEVPPKITYSRGLIDGDDAMLWDEGKKPDGTVSHATIYMVRENGAWKLAEEAARD